MRLVSPTGKLLSVNDKIDALDDYLEIFLGRILSGSCRLDHKVVLEMASISCKYLRLKELGVLNATYVGKGDL